MDEQNERDDAELKVYLFRAKIILSVFAALFFVSAILSVFSVTAFAGFIMCCVFSLTWTIVYNLFAQEKLSKYDKKYIRWYIFIVVVVCAITFFCFYIQFKPQLNVKINDNMTWNDIIPFIIAVKALADFGPIFKKGFRS